MKHLSIAFLLLACVPPALNAAEAPPPNVILIMADDLGYECIGADGGTSYKTPVLDAMAHTGVRFDHCFVQPLCTPTRMQLMTGLYNKRNYVDFGQMDPESFTFAHMMKHAGYATCIVGKWQLGADPNLPSTFGFDEHCLWQHTRRPDRYKNPGLEVNGREVDYSAGEYGPELINTFALDYIERKKDVPFFLYYPMILTHSPYDATPDSTDYHGEKAAKGTGKKRGKNADGIHQHFADMVEFMDKMIGRVNTQLDKLGLRDRTLVIFIGDNGTGAGTRSMMGDRVVIGGKGQMNASGMHVPLIASWPGRIASGKVCADLVDSTDLLPTLCQAASIELPAGKQFDGHSFFPQLLGESGEPREWYYSWYAPRRQFVGEFAATADHKLFSDGRFFDLTSDAAEKNPLKVESLTGDAAKAAKLLEGALAKYADVRPANLDRPAAGAKKNKQAKATDE
jgi:arylsulfatase A